MIRLALLFLLAFSVPATAQRVIAGLSQNRISISANFDGSEILIFGAVKRDAPPSDPGDQGIIVTVEGPTQAITVRRKERRALIWVNDASAEIDRAPSFYTVNTSGPLSEILLDRTDLHHRITPPRAIRDIGAPLLDANAAFDEALIRIREDQDLYQVNIGDVTVREGTLFSTSVSLPANLVEGRYVARIYLMEGGRVVSRYETSIDVAKAGLERFLYTLAHDDPLIYGCLSLAIAIAAGWGASAAFRYVSS